MRRSLWRHQEEAIAACTPMLEKAPGFVQMPTGSGKGEIIRSLALTWLAQERARRVVIGVPNRTLAFQQRAQFLNYGYGTDVPALVMEGYEWPPASRLTIATYASICRLERSFMSYHLQRSRTLLIADECHHFNIRASEYAKMLYYFKFRIGFSATPWSPGCAAMFGSNLIYALTLTEAQKAGALCDYELELDPSLNIASGRWQLYFVRDGSRFQKLDRSNAVFFDEYNTSARKVLNTKILDQFKDGLVHRIYANRMLLEGFDCAQCKTVYIEKFTDSEILTLQMAGRGLRKLDNQACRIVVSEKGTLETLRRALYRADNPSSAEDV